MTRDSSNITCMTRVLVATVLLSPAGVYAQQGRGGQALQPSRGSGRAGAVHVARLSAPQGFSVVLVLGEMQGSGAADTVPPAARKALADMKDFLPYKGYRLLDAQWTLCCGHSAVVTRLRGPEEQDYSLELYPSSTGSDGKWYVRFALREPASGEARSEIPSALRQTADVAAQKADVENQIRVLKERYSENHPEVRQARARLAELERAQVEARREGVTRRVMAASAGSRTRAIIDTSFTMEIGETVVVGTSRLKGDKALIALLTAVPSTKTSSR